MASYRHSWGDFKDNSSYTEEVMNLYRNRDHDVTEHNKDLFDESYCKPNQYFIYYSNKVHGNNLYLPLDDKYYKLTETQKIENGLPSSIDLLLDRWYTKIFFTSFIVFAGHQYNKIYSPSGIVLRLLNKPTRIEYFKQRLPGVSVIFAFMYLRYYYTLNTFIDYYSEKEEEYDRKLMELTGKKI